MSDTFFSGSITALITPMNRDGSLDFPSFENLADWQIREGTSALCAVGTTGESPTLSHTEHHAVVERAIKVAAGRVPVIAGAGSNSTAEATDLALHAQKAGAAAVLVVAPYYNKPTQEGLYRHFMTIADAISIPVILYNIPGRSMVDISVETMARLARHANIIGVKDATANLLRPLQLRQALDRPFNQLSGEDGTAVAFLASGGDGCISVTSNIAPALCANVQSAWKEGRVQDAMAIQDRLLPLHDAMFCESNPAPVKYAASLLGLAGETCRLPLAPLTEPSREKVRAALVATGLLD